MFHVADYTATMQSILLLVLVSQDQLLMLRKGAHYSITETKVKAYIKLSVAWLYSILLFSPAIIFWDVWAGYSTVADEECETEFHLSNLYLSVASVFSFLIPAVLLILLNGAIYLEIRKRLKGRICKVLIVIGKSEIGTCTLVSNLYLVKMSGCDFTVGLVIAFNFVYKYRQDRWPFGRAACKMFHVTDYTATMQSILLLVLVSQDHVLMLRKGAHYSITETKVKAYIKLSMAWLYSILLFSPAIIFWGRVGGLLDC
nr:hypothetical protein BaRGS_004593 [Batillaria attramentaria]